MNNMVADNINVQQKWSLALVFAISTWIIMSTLAQFRSWKTLGVPNLPQI